MGVGLLAGVVPSELPFPSDGVLRSVTSVTTKRRIVTTTSATVSQFSVLWVFEF